MSKHVFKINNVDIILIGIVYRFEEMRDFAFSF